MAIDKQVEEIIRYGVANGKSRQEVEQAISNYKLGITTKPTEQVETKPSFLDSIMEDFTARADRTGEILRREDSSALEKGVQVFGQGAGSAANVIEKTAEQIPGVKEITGAIGSGINWLSTSDYSPAKILGEKIGESKALQELTTLYDTDQNFKDSVDAVANVARLGGDVQMAADAVNLTKKATSRVIKGVDDVVPKIKTAIKDTAKEAIEKGKQLKTDIQVAIAKKNVSPQIETSTKRLFLEGTKRIDDPVSTYDKFLTQSKKAIVDSKADPAIAEVGSKIGKAFDKVIKQRQAVGKVMGSEIKKVGSKTINIEDSFPKFEQELMDSGAIYSKGKVKLSGSSKITKQDAGLLNEYISELNKLGSNPKANQIDAFLSRVPENLKVFKAKNNILSTTNGERMIKGSLSDIRNTLIKTPELSKYAKARKAYADLSDFIEEGTNFLGKKTQSGDFAKDASIAKSSVQSILNQGKKDWMLKLEQLTGYNAVDNSVLALQAMKDAGDFRGLSLLQAMSETGIPTKSGITKKLIDYTLSKGSELIAGNAEEQTRAFLKSLNR